MKRMLLMIFAVGMVCAYAGNYTWTNMVSTTGSWTNNVENWIDGDGNNPFEKGTGPAGADANVAFVPMAASVYGLSTVNWDGLPRMSSWTWGEVSIGALTYESDYPHRILNIANDNTTVSEHGINVTLGDPSGFDGYWRTSHGQVKLILPATESFTPELSHISLAKRLDIEVPDAGTKAKVGSVYASGTLVKRGAGELEVGGTTGSDTQIHVDGGTVTLAGRVGSPGVGDDLPVSGAWLHLDSSRTNLMQAYTGEDGRLYVTNWPDVRGNGNGAYYNAGWKRATTQTHLCPETHAPFLNMDALGGIPVMDFGATTNREDLVAVLGPAWCMLDVSPRCTNVREAFFVGAAYGGNVAFFGDTSSYHFCRGGAYVLTGSYSSKNLLNGTMFVDGELASPNSGRAPTYSTTGEFTPGVVSMAATNNVTFGLLGSDRRYTAFSGGIRICEIVVFTNALTQIERMEVHRHLQRKWQTKEHLEDVDAGAVTLASGTALGVKDGTVATVAEVTAVDGTLVKTGDGTLKIGALASLDGSDVKIDMRGGNVEIIGLPAVDDTQPAPDPYLWLDPNDYATRMTISNLTDNVTNYVAAWYDHRPEQNSVYAILPASTASDWGGSMPYLADGTNGHKVVDFAGYGHGKDKDSAYMKLNVNNSAANACEAFLVQAYKTSESRAAPFFSYGTDTALMSGGANQYLSTQYGKNYGRNAVWTFNGVPVDPMGTKQAPFVKGEFVVGSVSVGVNLTFTLLGGKDRIPGSGTTAFGGVQMGEYLLYDRKLTPAERRQTIAYLMKRWLGRSPEYAKTETTEIAEMSFPEGEAAVLDTDVDVNVKEVSGFNGDLVKKGVGTATVNAMACPDLTSISVDGGSLTLDFTLLQVPAYDFDATKGSSLETEEWTPEPYEGQPASDKVMRTNVTEWADARANGVIATYEAAVDFEAENGKSYIKRKPTLQQIEVRAGVYRPMVDFGGIRGQYPGSMNGRYGVPDTSSMFFNKRFTGNDKLVDFYTVFGDKSSTKPRQALFTDRATIPFYRGDGDTSSGKFGRVLGALLCGYGTSAAECRNGFASLDGVQVTPTNTVIKTGTHLVSFTPLSSQPVDTLAYCGPGYIVGSCHIGQQLAFKEALSTDERSKFLRYMMHKWFDEPWNFSSNAVDSIAVKAGASLTVAGEYMPDSIVVRTLGGSGTFVATDVTGVSTINVSPEEGPFTVAGKVTFADEVAVNVSLAAKPELDAYPVFTATELVNADIKDWTIDVSCDVPLYRTKFALARNGGTIFLLVKRPGTALTFR